MTGIISKHLDAIINEYKDTIVKLEAQLEAKDIAIQNLRGEVAKNTCMMCNFLERAVCHQQKVDLQADNVKLREALNDLLSVYPENINSSMLYKRTIDGSQISSSRRLVQIKEHKDG